MWEGTPTEPHGLWEGWQMALEALGQRWGVAQHGRDSLGQPRPTSANCPSANLGQPQPTSIKSAEGPSKCSERGGYEVTPRWRKDRMTASHREVSCPKKDIDHVQIWETKHNKIDHPLVAVSSLPFLLRTR
ncbi:hypothetical protein C8R44DRAFT_740137 [Mycena epipterygia]|nr:hypothetical protein C8R44DRAFT_740137 [Mycena epipterygia]